MTGIPFLRGFTRGKEEKKSLNSLMGMLSVLRVVFCFTVCFSWDTISHGGQPLSPVVQPMIRCPLLHGNCLSLVRWPTINVVCLCLTNPLTGIFWLGLVWFGFEVSRKEVTNAPLVFICSTTHDHGYYYFCFVFFSRIPKELYWNSNVLSIKI